jgi:hypothetical protein
MKFCYLVVGRTDDIHMVWHVFIVARLDYTCQKRGINFSNVLMPRFINILLVKQGVRFTSDVIIETQLTFSLKYE